MSYLLDVNVLIALVDSNHEHHDPAHRWFEKNRDGWATCAITENGLIRIVSNPRYPNSTNSPVVVAEMLAALKALPGYEFWPEAISILEGSVFRPNQLRSYQQITDTYLLGLAVRNRGHLATFDRHISTNAVIGGSSALYQIEI
ncbi:TA system VapC family ribonuclease toxin [Rhizobium sp. Rhizsp82]|uniref:TA system VapC family ribonuclease toxin n=1 Tax=Rhizobium sp. Rhizsp82 TaxID=3243057 RepID=UPI0039B5D38E